MTEQLAEANGIEIAYETFGERSDPAMLLIMGLGVQMIHWHPDFCRALADRGFHVIRFDNRDAGHSTKIDGGPVPNLAAAMAGDISSASYTLDDMAEDAVGLLDHLGAASAHLVGVSLGGMVAQTMAIRHPARVLSLTSIMSTTGARDVGQPHPEALPALLTPAPAERGAFVEHAVSIWRTIGSPGFERDESWIRQVAGEAFDRSFNPLGTARQLLAVVASGDRTEALGRVEVPTVVIHGSDDPLIDRSGGVATASAVPGAELLEIPGMGHDLPREAWPRIIDAVAANAERAKGQAKANAKAGAPR
jgi:pimeloyl-ACP methyl ester carboxylesterase